MVWIKKSYCLRARTEYIENVHFYPFYSQAAQTLLTVLCNMYGRSSAI